MKFRWHLKMLKKFRTPNGKFSLTLILLIINFVTYSQNYHFEHYNIHNGLGQSQVSSIVQDQFGYIWMGTQGGGLSRFDGINFKTFRKEDGLPANNISTIKIDKRNRLLIGTYRGFSVFDGQKFDYISRKRPINVRNVFSDKHNNIYTIFEKNGIGMFKNDSLIKLKPNDLTENFYFESVNFDAQNTLHLAYPEGILYQFKDKKIKEILRMPKGFLIRNFLFTSNNELWVSTNRGIYKIKQIKAQLSEKDLQKITDSFATTMIQTRSGDIWIGLFQGALRIDKNNDFIYFNGKNGFTNSTINQIIEDRDGIIWLATDGDGAYKFTDSPFTFINQSNGLVDNTVYGILPDTKNRFWIGSFTKGLSLIDNYKVQKTFDSKNGLKNNYISNSFMDSKGNKWFGVGREFLMKIDINDNIKNYSYRQSDCFAPILSFAEGENNEIWFGTLCGVYLFKNDKFRHFTDKDGLLMNRTPKIVKIAPNTFVVFSMNGANLIKDYKVIPFKEAGTWQNSRVVSTAFDIKNNVLFWGDMEEGISAYNFNTKKKHHYSTRDGLTSNLIYNLKLDKNADLWVGTEKGIEKITFSADWKIKNIRYYTQNEGMNNVETNESSMAFDANGTLWIGTINGAFQYHPEKDKIVNKPIKVQLTEVKLLLDTTKIEQFAKKIDQWNKVYEGLELPHELNNLSFQYIGINHQNPKETVYQYKLEGFDKDWSMPTTKTEIIYTNLPANEFTLMIRASNSCGEWGNEITKYSFKIKPPFWQTWWFGLLATSSLIAGIFLFQRAYSRYQTNKVLTFERMKQEAESEVRKQIAQDFHDELGNRLAAITTQSSLLKMKIKEESENRKIVSEIEDNARKLYTDTKDFIWTIDPESNRLNELAIYIKDFGEKLFQYTEIEFIVKNEILDQYQEIILPAGWSIQIIMIFKEAMTNALKHAQAKHVYFDFEINEKNFSFSLKDDGKGLNLENNGSAHKGLNNMQIRADKVKCKLTINQIQPNGTKILLDGKIPKK